jgi:hypothetical protein
MVLRTASRACSLAFASIMTSTELMSTYRYRVSDDVIAKVRAVSRDSDQCTTGRTPGGQVLSAVQSLLIVHVPLHETDVVKVED